MKLKLNHLALAAAMIPLVASAQFSDDKIRIGVLTDMSGPFADFAGNGSVEAAKMAVEKLGGKIAGKPVEVVFADHQNKVDVGAGIARKWFEIEGVDVILEVPQTTVAMAVSDLAKERGKAAIFSSAATSTLSGTKCTPNTIMWTWDSWSYANNTSRRIVKNGGDAWFLLTVDYAFGQALDKDIRQAVNAAGGKVVGSVKHPLNSMDMASFVLQAQSSKAKIIGLANGGADNARSIKQGVEFGLTKRQQFAGMMTNLPDIRSLGLETAKGMYLSTVFYWDRDQNTRAFAKELASDEKTIGVQRTV